MRKVSERSRRHPFISETKQKIKERAQLGHNDLQVVRVDEGGYFILSHGLQGEDGVPVIFEMKRDNFEYILTWKDPVLERDFYNYFNQRSFRVVSRHFNYEDDIYDELVIEW
jgi:hypothetical protein